MEIKGRYPTMPEWYNEYIDSEVDLVAEPKQCCPFHKEKTPSFSYDVKTGRWRCFGKCHTGGGVKQAHRIYMGYDTDEEADQSLRSIYSIVTKKSLEEVANEALYVSEEKIEETTLYLEACALANSVERWLELDFVMSKTPVDSRELSILILNWEGNQCIIRRKEN